MGTALTGGGKLKVLNVLTLPAGAPSPLCKGKSISKFTFSSAFPGLRDGKDTLLFWKRQLFDEAGFVGGVPRGSGADRSYRGL